MIPLLAVGFFLTLERLSSWYFDTVIMAELEPSHAGGIITLSDDNFQQQVLQADGPVLVDFWAAWCGACKALAPTIDQLAAEYAGRIVVGKLDADSNFKVSQEYNISAIPTVILFKDGKIKERFVGVHGEQDYQAVLDKCVATVSNQRSSMSRTTRADAGPGRGPGRMR